MRSAQETFPWWDSRVLPLLWGCHGWSFPWLSSEIPVSCNAQRELPSLNCPEQGEMGLVRPSPPPFQNHGRISAPQPPPGCDFGALNPFLMALEEVPATSLQKERDKVVVSRSWMVLNHLADFPRDGLAARGSWICALPMDGAHPG